jgi:hypothetical protein
MSYEEVYKKGLEVGWPGLTFQEHAVLLYYKVTERVLESERTTNGESECSSK